MDNELLNLSDAAAILGLTDTRTVLRLLRRHGIPVVRLGRRVRVQRTDLQRLVRASLDFAKGAPQENTASKSSEHGSSHARAGRTVAGMYNTNNNTNSKSTTKRRGWKQSVERGLYRVHRPTCPSSTDHKVRASTDCDCLWMCRVTERSGQTNDKRFEAKNVVEARAAAKRMSNEARDRRSEPEGTASPGRMRTITLSQFFHDRFVKEFVGRPTTLDLYQTTFKSSIEPFLGAIRLHNLTTLHIRQYLNNDLMEMDMTLRRQRGYRSADWIKYRYIVLRAVISKAVELGYRTSNPASKIKPPDPLPLQPGEREGRSALKAFDELQYRRLLATLDLSRPAHRRYRGLLRLGFEMGLRNSETRGLIWANIDFDEMLIYVKHQIDKDNMTVVAPKGKRARVLDARPALLADLLILREDERRLGRGDDRDFVFSGEILGKAISEELINDMMAKLQRKAGLLDDLGKPLLTFHGLRHSFATLAITRGVPLKLVSEYLGHWSVLQTEETYWHLLKGSLRQVADAFDDLGVDDAA